MIDNAADIDVRGVIKHSRLKRCRTCTKWFIDRTDNNSKETCSPECTNRYWTRGRRQAAGHKLDTSRRKKRTT